MSEHGNLDAMKQAHLLLVYGTYPCAYTEHAVNTLVTRGIPFAYRARMEIENTEDFLRPLVKLTPNLKQSMPSIVLLERYGQGDYRGMPFTDDSAQTIETILLLPKIKEHLRAVICGNPRGVLLQS